MAIHFVPNTTPGVSVVNFWPNGDHSHALIVAWCIAVDEDGEDLPASPVTTEARADVWCYLQTLADGIVWYEFPDDQSTTSLDKAREHAAACWKELTESRARRAEKRAAQEAERQAQVEAVRKARLELQRPR